MYFVYIITSQKDSRTYTGHTKNVKKRLNEHNSGRVKSTKHRRPFEILFTERFSNQKEAKERELWWKSAKGRTKLKEFFNYKVLIL